MGHFVNEIVIESKHGAGSGHYMEIMRIFKEAEKSEGLDLIFKMTTLDSIFGYGPGSEEISTVEFTEPNADNGLRDIIVKSKQIYYKDEENKIVDREEDLGTKIYKIFNKYKLIRKKGEWNKLTITYKDKAIYEVTPKYTDAFSLASYENTFIGLIYGELIPRRLHKKVSAFDDITGDNIPDLVFVERPSGGNVYWPFMVRVLSIDKDKVTEYPPIKAGGEVYYFADFNNDGTLEFVNTDQEGNFAYNEDGMAISDYVWSLDVDSREYIKTSHISLKDSMDE